MKKELSPEQMARLEKIAAMPEEDIDTDDIPEAPLRNWALSKRSRLYRALKQPVTIRLDADVLDWFKSETDGSGYQTEINRVLREHVLAMEKRRA